MEKGNEDFTVDDQGLVYRDKGKILCGLTKGTTPISIVIPEGVEEIEEQAFCHKSIRFIKLPMTLRIIGDGAFWGTSAKVTSDGLLENIILKGSKYPDVRQLYHGETRLPVKSLIIEAEDFYIFGGAFSEWTDLESVIVNGDIRQIGFGAFRGCTNLRTFLVNGAFYEIEGSAFRGCDSMELKTDRYTSHLMDLGLKSKTLWGMYDLGVLNSEWNDSPKELSWGELHTKSCYEWNSYLTDHNGVNRIDCGTFKDPICLNNISKTKYDAAYLEWDGWQMPTVEDFIELINECSWEKESQSNKWKVIGPNNNYIYFRSDRKYWSSTQFKDKSYAWLLKFKDNGPTLSLERRCEGIPIRPVSHSNNPNHFYDSDLSKWEDNPHLLSLKLMDKCDTWWDCGFDWLKSDTSEKTGPNTEELAMRNDTLSMFKMGYHELCIYNLEQAANWFEKAAKANHAVSQYAIGYCYLFGIGVEKNEAKALEWLKEAATLKDFDAETLLLEIIKESDRD